MAPELIAGARRDSQRNQQRGTDATESRERPHLAFAAQER